MKISGVFRAGEGAEILTPPPPPTKKFQSFKNRAANTQKTYMKWFTTIIRMCLKPQVTSSFALCLLRGWEILKLMQRARYTLNYKTKEISPQLVMQFHVPSFP